MYNLLHNNKVYEIIGILPNNAYGHIGIWRWELKLREQDGYETRLYANTDELEHIFKEGKFK